MFALFQIKGKQIDISWIQQKQNYTYITIVAVTGKTYLYLLLVLRHSMGMHVDMCAAADKLRPASNSITRL